MPAYLIASGACSREEPQPKFLAGDDDVARLHFVLELRPDALEGVLRQLLRGVQYQEPARDDGIRVHVVAELPHFASHAHTLLGSVILPLIADAAAVAGEAEIDVTPPRCPAGPRKFRFDVDNPTSPGPSSPKDPPMQGPQHGASTMAPASMNCSTRPAQRFHVLRPRRRDHDHAHALSDGLLAHDVRDDFQVLEPPVGAAPDEDLVDLPALDLGHVDDIVHVVGTGHLRRHLRQVVLFDRRIIRRPCRSSGLYPVYSRALALLRRPRSFYPAR